MRTITKLLAVPAAGVLVAAAAQGTAHATPPPEGSVQTIEGAEVWVPDGWVAYEAMHPDGYAAYCLTPEVSAGAEDCLVTFAQVDPPLTSDTEGALPSDPQYCSPDDTSATRNLTAGNTRYFGGRAADFRHWTWTCGDGSQTEYAQYVSPELDGYALTSDQATPDVLEMMAQIATQSSLPAPVSNLRLYDHGVVTSVTADHDGYDVSVDRLIPNGDSPIDEDSKTIVYHVPASAVSGTAPYVGAYSTIMTDGATVFSAYTSAYPG